MRPTLLPLDASRLAIHCLADKLDTRRPTSTHTRTLKDGTTKRIVRRGARKVCDGAKTLMLEILMPLTRKAASRALHTPLLWQQLVTDTGYQVPRIEVDGESLAEKRGMCARTIRNYLRQLKTHGFVVGYQWRGSRARFYLWINPAFLWESPVEATETALNARLQGPAQAPFQGAAGKNFPHTEVLESRESQKGEIGEVDKMTPAAQKRTPLLESEGRSQAVPTDVGAKDRHRGRAAARADQPAQPAGATPQEARIARAKAFVVEFWAYAKPLLYPHTTFRPDEERKALTAIYNGVYRPTLSTVPDARWEQAHRDLLTRVNLVHYHLQRYPDRYCDTPYAVVHAGRGYFDQENKHGFEGSRLWLARRRNKGGIPPLEKALRKADTELRQRLALDRGEKIPASQDAKRKDLVSLYHHHYTRIRRLGGETALRLYHAQLAVLGIVPPALA
jgi:hypothetical protein